MNPWHNVNKNKITSTEFVSCIEISKGSKNKYELDKESGLLRLDRILYTSTMYPQNYGFIPLTLSDDGDPLDVLVLCSEPLIPLSLIDSKPIGVLFMNDQGALDEKIIAICKGDPFYNTYNDISDLPTHILEEIRHFFEVYKQLENKKTEVHKMQNKDAAIKVIEESIERYKKKFNK